jgi:lysozyme
MTAVPYLPVTTSDTVIDISHYENVSQDFAVVAASAINAVILKATQGIGFVDPTFLVRAAEASAAGLLVGAYHFLDGSDPFKQMAHFRKIVGVTGITWLSIDWEPYPQSQASQLHAEEAVSALRSHAPQRAGDTGQWPVIYMNRYMLAEPSPTLMNCALWLAEYGSRPICPPGFSSWKLWQHTDGNVGSSVVPVPGIGPCDRSKFAGTAQQLKQWWENPVP